MASTSSFVVVSTAFVLESKTDVEQIPTTLVATSLGRGNQSQNPIIRELISCSRFRTLIWSSYTSLHVMHHHVKARGLLVESESCRTNVCHFHTSANKLIITCAFTIILKPDKWLNWSQAITCPCIHIPYIICCDCSICIYCYIWCCICQISSSSCAECCWDWLVPIEDEDCLL